MNARAIAQEVVSWYFDHLDPCKPHSSNVHNCLQRPVLSLTRGILHDHRDNLHRNNHGKEEEKKCASGDGQGVLDKSSWNFSMDNKASQDMYESLGRRDKARLEAFLIGIESAVPSEMGRATSPLSTTSSFSTIPEEPPQQKRGGKQVDSSPVLTSLNNRGKALFRSVSVDAPFTREQPQIIQHGLLIRLELYIRSLYRVRSLGRDCVIAEEPDRAIQARSRMIVSAFVSTVGCVRLMSPVLTNLLVNLTKGLLAVEYVGEDLLRVIRRIVTEYEHGTSFASLAFLSSPEASAETRLTPMIEKYIRFLQSDWKNHEAACELERMLACSLDRNMRRYLKTVEFQSIGHLLEVCQGFRHELNNIELTPTSACGPLDLCNKPDAVRQAIMDLQREIITINGHVLPPVTSRKDLVHLLSQSLNSRTLTATPVNKETVTEEEGASSPIGNSGGTPSYISTDPGKNRHASFHLSTVNLLTRRLIIAASRTGTGGDAYFIVRDLFGDDDVAVVPAQVLPHHVRASRVGSIEIQVRLASVTIKCHGSFDIYPKSLVGCCEPLIQLHTTSSETIYLQELRPGDSSSDENCLEDDGSRSSDGMECLVLQEKQTSKTGHRTLSIRPALYEKVEVWNALS